MGRVVTATRSCYDPRIPQHNLRCVVMSNFFNAGPNVARVFPYIQYAHMIIDCRSLRPTSTELFTHTYHTIAVVAEFKWVDCRCIRIVSRTVTIL